jgi:hypothetical protein
MGVPLSENTPLFDRNSSGVQRSNVKRIFKAIGPKSATRNSWTGPALQEPIELVSPSEIGAATSRERKHIGVVPAPANPATVSSHKQSA